MRNFSWSNNLLLYSSLSACRLKAERHSFQDSDKRLFSSRKRVDNQPFCNFLFFLRPWLPIVAYIASAAKLLVEVVGSATNFLWPSFSHSLDIVKQLIFLFLTTTVFSCTSCLWSMPRTIHGYTQTSPVFPREQHCGPKFLGEGFFCLVVLGGIEENLVFSSFFRSQHYWNFFVCKVIFNFLTTSLFVCQWPTSKRQRNYFDGYNSCA